MFSPAPGYLIRPARSDDEDLEALRIIGHCLYSYPMEELTKSRTRDDLANSWHLRCAKRPGETMLLTRKGLEDGDHAVVGATRITPDPGGDRDPDTDEVVNWSITAIMPDHRGKGLSKPLREAAIAGTKKQVIKSRVEKDNNKSWRVAEKMGYQHERDDGKDRIYVLKLTPQRKTAAEEVVRVVSEENEPVGPNLDLRTMQVLLRTNQPASSDEQNQREQTMRKAAAMWGLTKAADFDRPRSLDADADRNRGLNAVRAETDPLHEPGEGRQMDMMPDVKIGIDMSDLVTWARKNPEVTGGLGLAAAVGVPTAALFALDDDEETHPLQALVPAGFAGLFGGWGGRQFRRVDDFLHPGWRQRQYLLDNVEGAQGDSENLMVPSPHKIAGDYPDQPMRREQRIRNDGDHDKPTEPNEDDYREVELVRDASRAEAAAKGGREGEEVQEKTAMHVPDELIKFAMTDHEAGVPEKGTTKGQKVPESGEQNQTSSEGPNAYAKTLVEAGGEVPDELVEDAVNGD